MARGAAAALKTESQSLKRLHQRRRSQQSRHLLPFNRIAVRNVQADSNLLTTSEAKFDSLSPMIQATAAF